MYLIPVQPVEHEMWLSPGEWLADLPPRVVIFCPDRSPITSFTLSLRFHIGDSRVLTERGFRQGGLSAVHQSVISSSHSKILSCERRNTALGKCPTRVISGMGRQKRTRHLLLFSPSAGFLSRPPGSLPASPSHLCH